METQVKYDVFISYSTVDKLIAEAVCGYLESHKIRCFVAYRDIPKGVDWALAIPPAIKESKMMLAVFSRSFNISTQTDNELHIAEKVKIPVLTFRLSDDDFEGVKEYFLTKSNWIDAFPEPEKQFGELLKSIALLINRKDVIQQRDTIKQVVEPSESSEVQSLCEQAKLLLYSGLENRDPQKAFYLFRKAAQKGSPEAEYQLGLCYWSGLGIAQSWKHAKEWLTKASDHGHYRAMYELGCIYHYAIGCKQNTMQALSLYTASAEGGYGRAAKVLGLVYNTGELGVQDKERSDEWYEKAQELLLEQIFEHDDPEAMHVLASSYMDGEGVERRDYGLCIDYAKRGANLNNADAMNLLYICYANGLGVPQDEEEAFKWLQMAADLDHRHALTSMSAELEDSGDYDKARWYLMKAAQRGHAEAQGYIAVSYQTGTALFKKDEKLAQRWYDIAIESGSLEALYNHAINLENKEENQQENQALAHTYYKKAAMQNYYPSFVALGNNYYGGNLAVEENDIEAERWYKKFVDIYDSIQAEGLECIWYPSGQGSLSKLNFEDSFERTILIRACENLAWIYRNSKTVEHNEAEAERLEAIIQRIKPDANKKNGAK